MFGRLPWAASGLILLAAFGLRLWGIGFGLPELFHPDEPAYVLQALAVGLGIPDGLTFANPPLFKYLLLGEYAAIYAWLNLAGATHSPQEFIDQFRADPSRLYLAARVTSAVFGALTSVAAAALATQIAGRRAGLIAGALTAVTYLLVREAHFGVNDALVTLLVTLGLVFCVRVAQGGSRRDYVAASALAGLAFAAKYYGLALLAPLFLAHLARPKSVARRTTELAFGLAACLMAAMITFPSLVTEPTRVVQDIHLHLFQDAIGGYDGLDSAGGYVFYARAMLIGLGWPLLIASAAGLALSALTRRRERLVVASLPIVLLGVLGASQLYFARFALPAVPALLVGASLALDSLIELQTVIGLAATLIVAAPTLVDAMRFDALLQRPETRMLAREWIDSSLPDGVLVAVDSPPFGPTLGSVRDHRRLVTNEAALFDVPLDEYRARGVDYIVESSFTSEARAADPAREARRLAFKEALQREAKQEMQFRPYVGDVEPAFIYDEIYAPFNALDQLERPGPTITVYRLTR